MKAWTVDLSEAATESRRDDGRRELWEQYSSTGGSVEARNALLLAYRPLVTTVVKMLPGAVRAHWDHEELESLGLLGLLDAIRRWEPRARFETYAATRIRGAIYDELRRLDWLPRRLRLQVVACNRAVDELTSELGRVPKGVEMLAAAGLAPGEEQSKALMALSSSQLLHLDDVVSRPGDSPVELVSLDEWSDPELSAVRASSLEELRRAIRQLGHRQRTVVVLHYLGGLSQTEVAAALGLSDSRVSQIAKAGLRSLRTILTDDEQQDQLSTRSTGQRLPAQSASSDPRAEPVLNCEAQYAVA